MKNKKIYAALDTYEQDIEQSILSRETPIVAISQKRKKILIGSARGTLAKIHKNKNINIRINEQDLIKLKEKSLEEGLPYQTLIGSILHKYASGMLIHA